MPQFKFFLFFLFPLLYSLKLLIFAKSLVMGERYDIGIDIGEGRGWWYVHGLSTHDKVYELNKQMCDMGNIMDTQCFWDVVYAQIKASREASERRFAKYIKQNEDIMEEKKTKKMTKAEAFEWLKHKKVAVTGDTITLQNKLFNIGYKWCDGSIVAMPMIDFLFIDDETFQFTESLSHFRNCGYTEISANDILSIEIVDEKKDDERKGKILDEIAKLGEKISDLIEEYEGDIIIEINQYEVLLRNSGDILYRK